MERFHWIGRIFKVERGVKLSGAPDFERRSGRVNGHLSKERDIRVAQFHSLALAVTLV